MEKKCIVSEYEMAFCYNENETDMHYNGYEMEMKSK